MRCTFSQHVFFGDGDAVMQVSYPKQAACGCERMGGPRIYFCKGCFDWRFMRPSFSDRRCPTGQHRSGIWESILKIEEVAA